jgi:acyl phosphate:glycerol-3-phosphate acyltransferase
VKPALLLLASYLIGAFPTSYLVGKLVRGIDLRQHGSGNLGATNTFRVLGWSAAVPVFIVDIVKGLVPTAFFPRWDGSPEQTWAIGYGAAAIIGHVFSIYVGFKGGKGVATAAGVFLALAPVAVGVGMAVWVVVLSISGYVSLASVLSAVVVPIVVLIVEGVGPVFGLALAIGLFVIFAHRANIKRLSRGEEHRFRRKTEPSA